MGKPAARVTDMTAHGTPLGVGPGSSNVTIGFLPAWRGIPLAAAGALQVAQTAADTSMRAAEATTAAATGPALPAAKTAEETLKTSLAISMGASMNAFAGMSDIHTCPVLVPAPPHGPGVVINGSPTVLINNMPACRQGDTVLEALGGPDTITGGCTSVLIGDSGSGGGLGGSPLFAAASDLGLLDQLSAALSNFAADAEAALNSFVDEAKQTVSDLFDSASQALSEMWTSATAFHFEDRDALNGPPPTFDQITEPDSGWQLLPPEMSIYHDNQQGKPELKYVHPDGREAVFDGDTLAPVTDPEFKGTYNYVTPALPPKDATDVGGWVDYGVKGVGHVIADVIPYKVLGGNERKKE